MRLARPLCAASLIAAAPAVAAAQDFGAIQQAPEYSRGYNVSVRERIHPEWQALGINLGPYQISPQVAITPLYTDNEKDATTNTVSDLSFRIQPAIQIGSNWAQNGFGISAYVAQTEHVNTSEDNSTEYGAIGTGRVDISSDLGLDIRGEAQHLLLARSDPDIPIDSLGPVMFDREGIQAVLTKTFPRIQIRGVAGVRNESFGTVGAPGGGVYDFTLRGGTYASFSGRVSYGISPAIAVFVGALYNPSFRPSQGGVNFNAQTTSVAGGVNFDLTRLARGEISVGYLYDTYSTPGTTASSGLAFSANLQYFPTELTTITLAGARSSAPTSALGTAGGTALDGSVTIDHELLRNVILSASAGAGKTDYTFISRHDSSYGGSLGATYLMNRLVSLDLNYAYRNSNSTGLNAKRSYADNRLSFTVRLTR